MSDESKIFRTKTGYCQVLPDKIVLTRDGISGSAAKLTVGSNISGILIIYSLFAVVLFYFSFENYQKEKYVTSIVSAVAGLYFIYVILSSLNNSATPVVFRDRIKTVKYKKGIPGLIRGRFEIFFADDLGKIKKRLIILPGTMNEGKSESERALKILREEKLIVRG